MTKTGKKKAAKTVRRKRGLQEGDLVPEWARDKAIDLGACLDTEEEFGTVKYALDHHLDWLLQDGIEILADPRLRDVLAKRGITIKRRGRAPTRPTWIIEGLPSHIEVVGVDGRLEIVLQVGPLVGEVCGSRS